LPEHFCAVCAIHDNVARAGAYGAQANCDRLFIDFNGGIKIVIPARKRVRPRKDKRGVDLISDALPFGRPWYAGSNAVANAIGYAEHRSRSHDAVIRVYDESGNVIETHEHKGYFKEW
jgi:hypothetical protein